MFRIKVTVHILLKKRRAVNKTRFAMHRNGKTRRYTAHKRFLRSPQKTGADFRQEHGIMTAEFWVNLELTRQGK